MGHLERAADGRRSVPLLEELVVSSSFRTTIQQSGRGRRRGRTLLHLCKQFQHLSTIVSEEEGKLKSDILRENTFGTKKTKEAERNAQRRCLRQEKLRDFPPT